ncbi:MAG: HD domain-containing protein [Actinobacteria bacterium]|nr:HD domain-containing protein [Actinomycetota bacterium]
MSDRTAQAPIAGPDVANPASLHARSLDLFRNLSIGRKIAVPFLLLLATIALIGTPLASNYVAGVLDQQAAAELVSRTDSVQAFFEFIRDDLRADTEALGARPDLFDSVVGGEVAYLSDVVSKERRRQDHDFVLIFDTRAAAPTLLTTDFLGANPDFFASEDIVRSVLFEAGFVEILDIAPASLRASDPAASTVPDDDGGLFNGPRSSAALVAAAPITKGTQTIGFVVMGTYLSPALLYSAAKAVGGFRIESDQAFPKYVISMYAVAADGVGHVVSSSGEFTPSSEETYLTADGVDLPVVKAPSSSTDCGACHSSLAAKVTLGTQGLRRPTVTHLSMAEQGRFMVVHSALVFGGRQQGVFSILADTQELAGAQVTARNSLLAGTFTLLVLILIISYKVSRAITRPIAHLTEAAANIARGELEPFVPLRSSDEIGRLSRSIATMTESLQNSSNTIQGRLEEMSLLYAFSSAANSSLDLQDILQTLLQSTARALGADSGSIMMVGRDGTELQVMASIERHRVRNADARVPISEGIAGWVAQHRQTLILPRDFSSHPALNEFRHGDVASSICVPIENKDVVLGVLNLKSSTDPDRFTEDTATLVTALTNQAAIAIDKANLFSALTDLQDCVVRALGAAIDAKDRYTQGHSTVVARYGAQLAAAAGLSGTDLRDLEYAGYLHDLGKIGIHDDILNKEGRLTPEERNVIRTHPVISATIIEPVGFSWELIAAVRHHHEWWNGAGYPDGLKGRQIPLGARILAVVDAFEAMTAVRPYKPALTFEEAWMEISRMAGTQFDPDMVELFLGILDTLTATQPLAKLRA